MTATPAPLVAATDFSAHARHAAERAALLAAELKVPLTVLHAVSGDALDELRRLIGPGHALEQRLSDDARQALQRLAGELATAHAIAVRTDVAVGHVLTAVRDAADALDAALIVLGARGAGFVRRLVLGSTAERLLRRTSRPVLVVRERPRAPYRRVLVPLDFSAWSAPAIALARGIAPQARLVLLAAWRVPFEDKMRYDGVDAATLDHYRRDELALTTRRLHDAAADAGLQPADWEPCIVEGEAALRIVEQEQEQDCDLVVLGKQGRNFLEDLLLGSTTKRVLAEGSADVLVSTARAAAGA